MKKVFLVLLVISLVLAVASCKEKEVQKEGTLADHVNIETLEKDSLNVSLSLPSSWVESSSSYQGAEIRHYTSMLDKNTSDFFAESVAVTSEKLEGNTSLEDYAASNIEALKMTFGDFEFINEPEAAKLGEYDSIRIVYTYSQGTFDIIIDQSFTVIDGTAYIVMCNATEDSYEEFADIFKTARESFKIN